MLEWWKHILRGPIPASFAVCAVVAGLAGWLVPPRTDPGDQARIYECSGAPGPAAGESDTAVAVGGYESASVRHLRVTEGVKTHFHRRHDETVTVLSGSGRIRLGDETRVVTAGTVVLIPRGMPHSLVVTGEVVEAVSVFSPAFDGKDRVDGDE